MYSRVIKILIIVSIPLLGVHMKAYDPQPPRYLLYRVLEPLGSYIVGTWGVRV